MNAQVTTRDESRRSTFWTVGYFRLLGLGACVGWFIPDLVTSYVLNEMRRQQEVQPPTEVFVAATNDRVEHGR